MAKKLLDVLVIDHDLKILVFNSRYSEGVIALLAKTSAQAEAIEDQFTSGDQIAADVSYGLRSIDWFPIVYSNHAHDAILSLVGKAAKILGIYPDIRQWALRVELVCNIVEAGKASLLQPNAKELNKLPVCQQEELLFELRDN